MRVADRISDVHCTVDLIWIFYCRPWSLLCGPYYTVLWYFMISLEPMEGNKIYLFVNNSWFGIYLILSNFYTALATLWHDFMPHCSITYTYS